MPVSRTNVASGVSRDTTTDVDYTEDDEAKTGGDLDC